MMCNCFQYYSIARLFIAYSAGHVPASFKTRIYSPYKGKDDAGKRAPFSSFDVKQKQDLKFNLSFGFYNTGIQNKEQIGDVPSESDFCVSLDNECLHSLHASQDSMDIFVD